MNLFDIATVEAKRKSLEEETMKEEFWQKEPSETGKILSEIKQLKKKEEQYKNAENEITNFSLNSNKIYKLNLQEKDANYEYFYIMNLL